MTILLLSIIYLAFISLGLPDALLGSAWPIMYHQFAVPVSYAGFVSIVISAGTIISSLQSDRMTRWLGTGKVTAISVAMTAIALLGFSFSSRYWMLLLWAIPYGLGAGSVDASLNNYVALHYSARHMSWLHCMWGIGASIGPTIMSYAVTGTMGWPGGYRIIGIMQVVLTAAILFSLPMWKGRSNPKSGNGETGKPMALKDIIALPGAKAVLLMFFCYCGVESTAGLWASSYLVLHLHVDPETAAGYAGLFYLGITAGRFLSGFITAKLSDNRMIRLGQTILLLGVLLLLLPLGTTVSLAAMVIIGLGCAPIYPSVIHSTPTNFGEDRSQAVIGVQMAAAYVGTLVMPPVYGLLANNISQGLFPWVLLLEGTCMMLMHMRLLKQVKQ